MPLKLIKRGAIYYLRGAVAGQRVYESTRLSDRRAAEAFRVRREAEIQQRAALGKSVTATFAEAALTYLQSGGEERYLDPILEYFGPKKRLSEIDNDAVNACARALHPMSKASTINRQVITPISAVVKLAAEDGLCDFRRFRRRKEPQGRLRWLQPEEAERLIEAADPRTALWITFLLGAGPRPIESFELERPDLYLDTSEVYFWRSKTEKARMVRYPPRTRQALAVYGLPSSGRVFLTPKGKPYKLYTGSGGQGAAAFNKAREAAGLGEDVTPYTCRHTWATWFYAQTRDFGELMDLGGWDKADTANRYRKIAPADLGARLLRHGWDLRTSAKSVQSQARKLRKVPEMRAG
jgi:integrase